MGQQGAQLFPALSASRAGVGTGKQQSEILPQSPVDRVLQRKWQHPRNELRGHTARKRTGSAGPGYGLAWSARSGSCVRLSKRRDRSTDQGSGQKNAVVSTAESQGCLLNSNFHGPAEGKYPKSRPSFKANDLVFNNRWFWSRKGFNSRSKGCKFARCACGKVEFPKWLCEPRLRYCF